MVASLSTWVWADARWHELRVDVAATPGFSFHMVGTRDPNVREAPNRIHAALLEVGAKWPGKRITVSFHPSRPWQLGSSMDLPIAVGVLMASGQIPYREGIRAIGTLDLKSSVSWVDPDRPAPPVGPGLFLYPMLAPWRRPSENWAPVATLADALAVVRTGEALKGEPAAQRVRSAPEWPSLLLTPKAVTALGLVAAGRHPAFVHGAPGVGKTEFARAVHALRSSAEPNLPFVEPTSSLTPVQLVGANGAFWAAGSGVLFLDELGELPLRTLECLRKPMEAMWNRDAPPTPLVIGATNPCPCGFKGHEALDCSCSAGRIARYQERFSAPFMDRFQVALALDMREERSPVPWEELAFKLRNAVEFQRSRGPWLGNAAMPMESLVVDSGFSREALETLQAWHKKSGLGLRALHHAMRVARTAADWGHRSRVTAHDAWLAVSYHPSQFRTTSTSDPWGPEHSWSKAMGLRSPAPQ
ncbi:MAG: ATP-binding protein [Schleiferiaceae bacterium]|jgi:magnesium chelatase family protein